MKALILALLVGCTGFNRTTLAASTVMLACDWGQTRSAAADGWRGTSEVNPIIGLNPSVNRVDAYFVSALFANAVIYTVLPKRFRWVIPTAIIGAQTHAIHNNIETVPSPACGL